MTNPGSTEGREGHRTGGPEATQNETRSESAVRMPDLRVGMVLVADGDFTCIENRTHVVVHRDDQTGEFWVPCTDGRHYLEGQRGDNDELIGLAADVSQLAAMEALRFYRDAWTFKAHKSRPGLEWRPKEELLDDCGKRARAALELVAAELAGITVKP